MSAQLQKESGQGLGSCIDYLSASQHKTRIIVWQNL